MVTSIAYLAAAGALVCVACGGQSQPSAATAQPGEAAGTGSSGDQHETLCPTTVLENTPKISAEISAPLWLVSFDDALPVSSVSRDAEGNVLVARSGAQTVKLAPDGKVLWTRPFGSLVGTDTAGNAYVAGALAGTLELGSDTLRSTGGSDVYVIKLDAAGSVLRAALLGGPEDDEVSSLAVDASANLVVSGRGLGTVRLDAAGRVLWTRSFFGSVALDSRGSTVLSGALVGSLDFGGGALASRGGADVFVVKLAPGGEHVFSQRFGAASTWQEGQAIAVDGSDNLLVGGVFDDTLDLGGGVLSLPAGSCPDEAWCEAAGFVAKLDSLGRLLWSSALGPLRSVSGVATDSDGNVVLSGVLPAGVPPFRAPLLAKLAAAGSLLWRRSEWPETGIGAGHGVAVDGCDSVLWAVSARSTVDSDELSYLAKLLP